MNYYYKCTIQNLDDIYRINRHFLSAFIYRGQQDSNWDLKSSLERVKETSVYRWAKNYSIEEKWMLHEFMKKYHLHSNRQINIDEKFEWLSIMQHYGAPTRLLDFTSSFYIAIYFAVMNSVSDASVWAINRHILRDSAHKAYNIPYKKGVALKDEVNMHFVNFSNRYIANKDKDDNVPKLVLPLEPYISSERLSRQQGLFLMPINSGETFMANLQHSFARKDSKMNEINFDEMLDIAKDADQNDYVQLIKFDIPINGQLTILHYLKQMNITSELLFPGLDGFARSLYHTVMMT